MTVAFLSDPRTEQTVTPIPQVAPEGVTLLEHRFSDEDDPPRVNMSGRLQARMLKILGWLRQPGADVYVWMDGQFTPERPDSVMWLVDRLTESGADLVAFHHPSRHSIREEIAWIEHKLPRSNRLMVRYTGDRFDLLLEALAAEPDFVDDHLYACGLVAYRNTPRVRAMCKDWWFHTSVYTNNDQLSLPFVAWRHGIRVHGLEGDVFHSGHFRWTRGKHHA